MMKNNRTKHGRNSSSRRPARGQMGFSLLELVVAMAVFLTVSGAAFSIFGQHANAANEQQTLSGVNIALRNAMTQMQMDLSGAGGNLLAGVTNAPPFYFSVIINNNVPTVDGGSAAACTPNSGWGYPTSSACFDSFTALSPNNSLVKPCTTAGGTQAPVLDIITSGPNLAAATTVTADDPNNPGNSTTQTNDATCYKSGDELLFLMTGTSSASTCDVSGDTFNFCMQVVKLTANATVSAGAIQLPTSASGSTASDPLGLVYTPGGTTYFPLTLHNNFPVGAYIVNLGSGANAITYSVMANPNNANDPQLVRCAGTSCTTSNAQVVADQIIGFKVGASLWNYQAANATDIANYIYNAANYCSDQVSGVNCLSWPPAAYDPYDFTLVRAVRASVIARTPPRDNPTLSLIKNGFDSGPYLVQEAATVVDLRNLSNVDTSN
jgi:prepilin-type N-terminal cleavage/methylation domain-containing protein